MRLSQPIKRVVERFSQWRHTIKPISEHEVEHNGVKYRVAKTNKGWLILFPHAKTVSLQEFIEMMNRENKSDSRKIELKGYWAGEDPGGNSRAQFRVSGPFTSQWSKDELRSDAQGNAGS